MRKSGGTFLMRRNMAKLGGIVISAMLAGLPGRPLMAGPAPTSSTCKMDWVPYWMGQIKRYQAYIRGAEQEIAEIEKQLIAIGKGSYSDPSLVDTKYLLEAGLRSASRSNDFDEQTAIRHLNMDRADILKYQKAIKALQKKIQDASAGECVF